MNNLILIALVLFTSACANETNSSEEDLNATNFQGSEFGEGGEFTELSLHQLFLETEFTELNCLKEQQMQAVEQGDDSMVPILEQTMGLIEENLETQGILDELLIKLCPGGKKCPAPRPNPCTEGKGCQFNCPIRIPELLNIWVPEDQVDGTTIQLINSDGEGCSDIVDMNPIEDSNQMIGITLETNNCCGGYIEVTKPFEFADGGEITYRVPVQCE